MRVTAIVPVNALSRAKSRLAPVLEPTERERLVFWLLSRVCAAVSDSCAVERIGVVSPDDVVLTWAEAHGFGAVTQRAGDLNAAVELGREWALAQGAETLLVLLGDLPLLDPEDVRALCDLAAELGHDGEVVGALVLAPDRAGEGTNGLALSPPSAFPFAFGASSYAQHIARARDHALATGRYIGPRTAFDVDGPAELKQIIERGLWTPRHCDAPPQGRRRMSDGRAG